MYVGCFKFLLFTSLLVTVPAYADVVEDTSAWRFVKSILDNKTIGGGVDLQHSVVQGLALGTKVRMESQPSYLSKYYTRVDQYGVSGYVSPLQILPGMSVPVGIGLSANSEIIFARQFPNQMDSIKALPYGLHHFPNSAENVERNLLVGDYVSFASRMNFVASYGMATQLLGPLSANATGYVGLSGEFFVQVFKMKDNKVRVKIESSRGRNGGVNGGINVWSPIRVFNVDFADQIITNETWSLLHLSPMSVSVEKGQRKKFMVDFVYDLNSPEAKAAYDDLMKGNIVKNAGKAGALMMQGTGVTDQDSVFMSNLTPTEKLFQRDRNLPPELRVVDRVFSGTNNNDYAGVGIRTDLNLLSVSDNSTLNKENVVSTNRAGEDRKFLFRSAKTDIHANLGWGSYRYDENVAFGFVVDLDKEQTDTKSSLMVLTRDFRASSERTMGQVEKNILKTFPEEDAKKIKKMLDEQWHLNTKAELSSLYLRTEFLFDPAAVEESMRISEAEIAKRFKKYFESNFSIPGPQGLATYDGNAHAIIETRIIGAQRPAFCQFIQCFGRDIEAIAYHLSRALDKNNSLQERVISFDLLKTFPLFNEIGAGFLASLLSKEQAAKLLHVRLTLQANNVPAINYESDFFKDQTAYETLSYVQNVLANRNYDLRLYKDAKGEYSPIGGRRNEVIAPESDITIAPPSSQSAN